jgi:hypothetical protein
MINHRRSSTLHLSSLCISAFRTLTRRAFTRRAFAFRAFASCAFASCASPLGRAVIFFFALLLLSIWSVPVAAQEPEGDTTAVCFWSTRGPICAEHATGVAVAGGDLEQVLTALLAGPTAQERAQGIWSAIPEHTLLAEAGIDPSGTIVVRLHVPPDALHHLDHDAFEAIVAQIGWTLEPFHWRDLRVQTWDPLTQQFIPLAAFLPQVPAPRKETALGGEETAPAFPTYVGQPPALGQGQPRGALSGKTVYVSAGHGWQWNEYVGNWRTQRPPYPNPPYEGPIIEDHNNAEAVNQYLLRYLWNAGAQVWPVRERDMNPVEVLVDGDLPIPSTGYREVGAWLTTAFTGTGHAGTDYRWTATVTSTPTASAVWTATLPADGEYAVTVWYRPGAGRVADARYTIHHAGGETTVLVDQRHHGITWHYIGSYAFRAGQVATVTLSNLSSQAGRVVVADAIRFGGGVFDDLTGIETDAPYPPWKPWWEVAAFYYTQRMGAPKPPGDVTSRPIYARWEHAGTGDDAVYVSWHSNGFAGYQETASGTETYVHNGEWLTRTEGSLELQHALHAELVHDIRAGWDDTWTDRGEKQMNLGELRELWDEDPATRMPGALIEIAFHDHPDDTDSLKEPAFNMLVARAVYQGIVKYFEQRDSVDLALLPEPPTRLRIVNSGAGQVTVRWSPSPIDALGLVGDAATGYRVYTSTDGLGWSNGEPVPATAYTLTGLEEGQLLFVRVTATNDGGESFPTETLAVRVGEVANVLLVNGFDRLNRTMAVSEADPAEGANVRLFLDRMNRYDYAVQHGQVISYPFDSASNEAVRDGLLGLNEYALVDWILGEESAPDETLDATERALLADFLGDGGALFLSGTEIGWHLDDLGADPAFYNTVLRADYVGDDAETYQLTPVAGSIFDGVGGFRFDASGMYDADYPDQLLPLNGSLAALAYSGGLGGIAAIQYADGCERLVLFGFPFETIWAAQRPAVMARVLNFLGLCLPATVNTTIAEPVDASAHNTIPPFAGTAAAGGMADLDRVEVQVQRASDDAYWSGGGWVTVPAWVVAAGTASWSYSLPVLSDGDYRLRARAWTTDGAVDESPAEADFTYDTLPPTAATLITPTGGVVVPAMVSVTLEWKPVPPDGGSPLAYGVVLDGEPLSPPGGTRQISYTVTQIAGGFHTWGVQVLDAAGNHAPWVTDTFRYPSLDTGIDTPVDGSAHNALPHFAGTAVVDDAVVLDRVEVQIQRVSDGRYWVTGTSWLTGSAWLTQSTWLTATAWVTAAGTVSWIFGLPWLDDDGYCLRARAWTMDGEVDLSPAEVCFTYDTLPPAATALITPTGGVTIQALSGVAFVWQAVAPDAGSPLAYVLDLDGLPYTTTHSTYTVTHVATGSHRWGVRVFDAAGNRSGWVTDTFSIWRYDVWLPVVMRRFEGSQAAPLLNGGFETDEGWVLNRLAVYDSTNVHSGGRSARVGIPPGEPGSDSYSSVAQTFVVPTGVAAALRLWVYPIGEENDPDDYHYVSLRDQSDVTHALDRFQSDARAWEQRAHDLSPYLGQAVTLYIGTRNDGDDDTTALYVDDVVLEVYPR